MVTEGPRSSRWRGKLPKILVAFGVALAVFFVANLLLPNDVEKRAAWLKMQAAAYVRQAAALSEGAEVMVDEHIHYGPYGGELRTRTATLTGEIAMPNAAVSPAKKRWTLTYTNFDEVSSFAFVK